MESLRGKLLIASPTLMDPNFRRTVVLVAAHDEQGALGLVLNRPLDVPLAELSPVLHSLAEPGSTLHRGGPVAPESAVVLADFRDLSLAALTIFGNVGFPSAECELSDEGWIVGQLAPDELWQPDSTQLWSTALRRKGGSYALLARMPEDPSVN